MPKNEKDEVITNLERTNTEMINKMSTLIDLTHKVLNKMKLQNQADRSGSVGGSASPGLHESHGEQDVVQQRAREHCQLLD